MPVIIWRHPRPQQVAGICLGQTDVTVDPRRIRRLADHIRRTARRLQAEPVIHVSPLQRSRLVGEQLAQLGWQLQVDPALIEFDFGDWDGRPWSTINREEMDHWCQHFADHAPGGGETLTQLFARVNNWLQNKPQLQLHLAVGHAGWMTAADMICQGLPIPTNPADWSVKAKYGKKARLIYTHQSTLSD
ncbi:histidine phosphatase family protein [Marinospirillum alkaliphilum]|uniref:Alpha-ribazole phosphatase n=1 Tax=Marinospirillum alkaliphilum DSM 21637 TaxID=1122209 RepID=A0A1K1XJA0_9GAMM|nr:histidine phosphatase family protein [Marinospirillum alkaliphilum]SFX49679.1 alpha-ribazole phosphatase [Marinospirillum alkaliphilum DSM 21637]